MPDTDRSTRPPPAETTESQHRVGLRVIAVYKAVQTLALILVALEAFRLNHTENFNQLVHWLQHLSLAGSNSLRWQLVGALRAMGPSKFVAIGSVALAYAALFATEGIGLWLRKYWAEWFTVIATGSLIPLELYETLLHFGWIKLATLLANVAIVAYLMRVALQSRAARHRRD